jgi:hypothetical protein
MHLPSAFSTRECTYTTILMRLAPRGKGHVPLARLDSLSCIRWFGGSFRETWGMI